MHPEPFLQSVAVVHACVSVLGKTACREIRLYSFAASLILPEGKNPEWVIQASGMLVELSVSGSDMRPAF